MPGKNCCRQPVPASWRSSLRSKWNSAFPARNATITASARSTGPTMWSPLRLSCPNASIAAKRPKRSWAFIPGTGSSWCFPNQASCQRSGRRFSAASGSKWRKTIPCPTRFSIRRRRRMKNGPSNPGGTSFWKQTDFISSIFTNDPTVLKSNAFYT